ncbi:Hypothetical protein c1776 [Escherichia coli CFT073]|uniref:Uncharacterized protein n=1 Tax=Escherichia coli O6:H1 (strain CFT073 / ATCC 700928 / UPEC) TaxID=199310 RepID=A0A0H2V733_ECOL6|nr:Hypothetical protein c1776 [Escherichia coli CFT073]
MPCCGIRHNFLLRLMPAISDPSSSDVLHQEWIPAPEYVRASVLLHQPVALIAAAHFATIHCDQNDCCNAAITRSVKQTAQKWLTE